MSTNIVTTVLTEIEETDDWKKLAKGQQRSARIRIRSELNRNPKFCKDALHARICAKQILEDEVRRVLQPAP